MEVDNTCALCRNHGELTAFLGHKRNCPWRDCQCELCHETWKKRHTNTEQIASRRAPSEDQQLRRREILNDGHEWPVQSQVESNEMEVKSLLDLSVRVIYDEIIAKLASNLMVNNTEKADVLQLDRNEIVENNNNIRKKLFNVGTYSPMRQKLVDFFVNQLPSFGDVVDHQHDLCLAFYNCVLNESFTHFDNICTAGHPLERIDPANLLQVIGKHSPYIETLKLQFYFPQRSLRLNTNFCQTLSKLEHLTSLTLSWNARGDDCYPFHEALGESCPKLKNLQLCGNLFPFGTNQLLALILGKKRSLLPRELFNIIAIDPAVAHFQFSRESLTPICSSLERFKTGFGRGIFSAADTVAFIFRHFSQLKEWNPCNDIPVNIFFRSISGIFLNFLFIHLLKR